MQHKQVIVVRERERETKGRDGFIHRAVYQTAAFLYCPGHIHVIFLSFFSHELEKKILQLDILENGEFQHQIWVRRFDNERAKI